MIAMLYSLLQPLVLPFAVIYYGLGYVAFRYMLAFVYIREYEGEGKIFIPLFNRYMFCK